MTVLIIVLSVVTVVLLVAVALLAVLLYDAHINTTALRTELAKYIPGTDEFLTQFNCEDGGRS